MGMRTKPPFISRGAVTHGICSH